MQQPSDKSRLIALLLALFLGAFGVHRFYVGKTSTGMLQLLLTCSFVGILANVIWVTIDWITIAAGSFEDREGRAVTLWTKSAITEPTYE